MLHAYGGLKQFFSFLLYYHRFLNCFRLSYFDSLQTAKATHQHAERLQRPSVPVQVHVLRGGRPNLLVLLDQHHANYPGTDDGKEGKGRRRPETDGIPWLVVVGPCCHSESVIGLAPEPQKQKVADDD
jgi:hypothetical protein